MNETEKIISAMNVSSTIVIDADKIIITAESLPPKNKCIYCGSLMHGSRCESCGAPKK